MKRLLYWTNLLMFFSTILACPGKRTPADTTQVEPGGVVSDSLALDSLATGMDSIRGTSLETKPDTLSKDEKYAKGRGEKREAPDHGTPDDSKLDSIKQEKAKGKKKD